MIMIYYCDKKRKKKLHILEVNIITIKTNIDLMSLAQRMHMMHFLQDVIQMTTIAFVSVINYYGLYLFWDILYI